MNNIESNKGEIVMYQPDETIRLEVRMDEETVWLTQQQMAELFQKDQSVVARHINNAFKEGELDENSNMVICIFCIILDISIAQQKYIVWM